MSVVKAGGLALDQDAERRSVHAATRQGPTYIADSAGGGSRGSPTRCGGVYEYCSLNKITTLIKLRIFFL